MEIRLGTLDRKIWSKDYLLESLLKCFLADENIVIDFSPEGSCAGSLGLYSLLDNFCSATGFDKSKITIKTGNMLESHPEYNIEKNHNCWYEIGMIQNWIKDKEFAFTNNPSKHFGNFISRNNWYRLWTATLLNKYHGDKTLQTYHYNLKVENYNPNKYSGIDDLLRYDCDVVTEALDFLKSCPRVLDIDFLKDLNNCKDSVFQHENSYYPIQHPSNLNLLQYYKEIFVDIVCEPNASGTCFLCTEKIWRPILAKRPFIVVSNSRYIYNLRKLGFQTFSYFWNEKYDDYSEADRIKKIEAVMEEISNWSLSELSNKLFEMKNILEHNYEVFKNLTSKKVYDIFQ